MLGRQDSASHRAAHGALALAYCNLECAAMIPLIPPAAQSSAITNALTIDVEDYFQVSAFAPYIERSEWERTPCRIERNIDRILELLDQHQAKATFFTLG